MNIENKKQLATIIFAAGLGLVAAFLTSQYVQMNIKSQTAALAREYQKKNAGVTKQVDAMKNELIRMQKQQAQLEKKQAQLKQDQQQIKAVASAPRAGGRVTTVPGQPQVEIVPVFSLRTPPGKRAMTILIDSLSAVGGLINPGDYVDIIAKLDIPKGHNSEGDKEDVTTVLFQNLQVLAVGTRFDPAQTQDAYDLQQRSRSLNLTLALGPEEAGLLTFAQENGKLQLSLRQPGDRKTEDLDVASWDRLADYVEEQQGTKLTTPKKKSTKSLLETDDGDGTESLIQVFRGGREL